MSCHLGRSLVLGSVNGRGVSRTQAVARFVKGQVGITTDMGSSGPSPLHVPPCLVALASLLCQPQWQGRRRCPAPRAEEVQCPPLDLTDGASPPEAVWPVLGTVLRAALDPWPALLRRRSARPAVLRALVTAHIWITAQPAKGCPLLLTARTPFSLMLTPKASQWNPVPGGLFKVRPHCQPSPSPLSTREKSKAVAVSLRPGR